MTSDPFALFDLWFADAQASEPNDPNAFALATVDARGQPSVRMVLLKGHGPDGFIFYTNQQSRKASDLADAPQAAMLFHWKSLRRQVRVEGGVTTVDDATADAYFASRGRASQLGAWASDQSRILPDRNTLEQRFSDVSERFDGVDVPRPPHWSGYLIRPDRIEFWNDGADRLHDRQVFERHGEGWHRYLVYP